MANNLDSLWKYNLTLLPLSGNLTPLAKKWSTDENKWLKSNSDLNHITDRITKKQVPVYPQQVGVITGHPSNNICVIDIDNKKNTPFIDMLRFLETNFGISEETTLAVETKSKGQHLYIQIDPDKHLGNRTNMRPTKQFEGKSGLDFRGTGGYVVAPPTTGYKFLNNLPIMKAPQAFYDWFFNKTNTPDDGGPSGEDLLYQALSAEGLQEGERNDLLFKIGAKYAYTFQNDPEAVNFVHNILKAAADKCQPPYRGDDEDAQLLSIAERTVEWQHQHANGLVDTQTPTIDIEQAATRSTSWYDIENYDAATNHTLPANELGFAHRLVSLAPKLVWRPETNAWWYKDIIWKKFPDLIDIKNIRKMSLEVIKADKIAGADQKQISKLETLISKNATITGLITTLKTYLTLEVEFNDLPSRDWIGFTNGALNIRTKEFLPELPDNVYATTEFDYAFDPKAIPRQWHKLVNYMFKGDQDMIDFFPVFLGYCLLGHNKDNKFFLFIGKADAGKSTLTRILRHIFGGNASLNMSPKIFAGRNISEGTKAAALIPAADARLVMADEIGDDDYLNEEDIKRITGGDTITIRENYAKTNFSYIPRFTPMMIGNDDPPFFSAASPALRRRLVKIQLNHPVTPEVRMANPTLEQDIIKEAPAVMNLILSGVDKYLAQPDRIDTMFPSSIIGNTKRYFEEADIFSGFFNDELIIDHDKHNRCYAHNLRAAFLAYQENYMIGEHQKKVTVTALGKRLKDANVERGRSNGRDYWIGMRLRNPSESVNGMVLNTNTDPNVKGGILVTFGQVITGSLAHDDNNQWFGTKFTTKKKDEESALHTH